MVVIETLKSLSEMSAVNLVNLVREKFSQLYSNLRDCVICLFLSVAIFPLRINVFVDLLLEVFISYWLH